MSCYDFHENKSNKCFLGNLANFKIGFYFVYSVFYCEVGLALKVFNHALDITASSSLGCLKGCTVDQELVLEFDVDLLIAHLFVRIIV